MRVGGFLPFSLSDYPGKVAAVVFAQGCNFRCPFCHNVELLPRARATAELVPLTWVAHHLQRRRAQLDGVVVSGGEPTIQSSMPAFLGWLRSIGLAVKLDTNGSRPDVLEAVLDENLVDYVAMDVKAPLETYDRLAGRRVDVAAIQRSIELIATSDVPHEFRTTVVPGLHRDGDLERCRALLPAASSHRAQAFRPSPTANERLRRLAVQGC